MRRELFHAILGLLFTTDVIDAFQNGFEVFCADGNWRLVVHRFYTLGVDYMERLVPA
jgi:hypothetical protein